ncbi:MAG TPA: class I SAM-dependent methyltransferase [Patescibacteria group bacterium]
MVEPICHVIDRSAESILDVGCGQGYPMRLIRHIMKPKRVVGVDLFKKYIVEAKEEGLHDDYVFCDVRKMKFKPRSFDVVIASQIIEHLPKKDTNKFIKDLERIAKKQVIIATPTGEMYHPAVDGNKLQLHKSFFYPEDFERLGYKVVKYGRKSVFGDNGIVHKINVDIIRKLIFFSNVIISPLYYMYQPFADYYFVAYKDVKRRK